MRKIFLMMGLITLGACALPYNSATQYLSAYGANPTPTKEDFVVCQGYSCQRQNTLHFSRSQWQEIEAFFDKGDITPAQERYAVSQAIGRMEELVAPITHTYKDVGNITHKPPTDGQQDCIDESLNTTTYLTLLQQNGLLRHHKVNVPHRKGGLTEWQHYTATMRDIETEQIYTVDSWYYDNGAWAQVIPVEAWHAGWSYKGENLRKAYQISDRGTWDRLPPWLEK